MLIRDGDRGEGDERSPTFAAHLHLHAHDLFWLRVQLHLLPLDLAWNPVVMTHTGWTPSFFPFAFVPPGTFCPELTLQLCRKPLFGLLGDLTAAARTRWVDPLLSWLAIATRHLRSPQRVPPQNILHTHNCRDVPLAEVSHSCVVPCDMGIMSPNHSCCCTNCVVCLNNVLLLVASSGSYRGNRQPLDIEKGKCQLLWL